jgi:hypothetical protein
MNDAVHSIVSVFLAIVGVAIVAVLVSKNTQTSNVIQAAASGFGNDLAVAVSPATTTGGVTPTLSYPMS